MVLGHNLNGRIPHKRQSSVVSNTAGALAFLECSAVAIV